MYAMYEEWMARYGRVYEHADEKEMRYNILMENVAYIDSFNKANDKPYKLSINQFADLSNEEFKASRNRFKGLMCSAQAGHFKYENVTAVPASIDWRKKGAVTPIKDQSTCGANWAFSAIAAVEGIHEITTGKLVALSKQELVDCDNNRENQGCEGGLMDDAYDFIKQHGLTSEANYPYNATNGTCNTRKEAQYAAKITGCGDATTNNEVALEKAIANQPVSVAIDAGGSDFQFYSGGIFTGACGADLDHGVAVVGYGVSNGMNYWLVKNSWGTGEEGYIRVQKDSGREGGLCGIAMQASYPTV